MEIINAFPIQALHGLVYGMLLFLVASGLTLIFGMMGVLNFAHGALYMLGAYFSFSILVYTGNFWLSLVVSPILVGVLSILMERYLLRKIHRFGHVHQLLLTFGVAYIIEEMVKWIWGNEPLPVKIPQFLTGSVSFLGIIYPKYRLFILLVSFVVFVILFLILFRTRAGIIVMAAVHNADMVNALGINVPLVFTLLFGVGGALAGLAGVIGGPYLITHPGMAATIIVDLFVVIVVGGLGSLGGALLASFLIGELQSFGVLFFPQLALVLEFLLMAVVLIIKPEGLLGEKE